MTEVAIERWTLDAGTPMIYKHFGRRVRMAFDPDQITEEEALHLLAIFLPQRGERRVAMRRIQV